MLKPDRATVASTGNGDADLEVTIGRKVGLFDGHGLVLEARAAER